MQTYSIAEAEARFEELVDRVELGEEFIITRDGEPCVKLVPWTEPEHTDSE